MFIVLILGRGTINGGKHLFRSLLGGRWAGPFGLSMWCVGGGRVTEMFMVMCGGWRSLATCSVWSPLLVLQVVREVSLSLFKNKGAAR